MPDPLKLCLAVACCWTGWAWLALSQERHWALVTHAQAGRPAGRWFMAVNSVLLGSALGLFIEAEGAAFGSLVWVLVVSVSAVGVAFTLAWRPEWLRPWARLSRPWSSGARAAAAGRPD